MKSLNPTACKPAGILPRPAILLRLACGVLLLLLIAGLQPRSGQAAGSAKQQMKENREKRNKVFDIIRDLESQKDQVLKQVSAIDEHVSAKEADIRKVKTELATAEKTAAELKQQADVMAANLSQYRDALAGRMRAIYMQGDMTYLDLLFQASDFGDLIDRLFFVQTIGQRDQGLISDTQDNQAALNDQMRRLEEKRQEISRIKAQLEIERAALLAQQDEKREVAEAIRNSIALQGRIAADLEEKNKQIAAALRRAQRPGGGGYSGKWGGSFQRPCGGPIVSGFGYRNHPIFGKRKMHTGVDIAAPEGTTIGAAAAGKVIDTGRMGGYGLAVLIDHGSGRATLYGHCSQINCKVGDEVKVGEKIAEVGSTGYSTGPHCHFEVRINGTPVDPLKEL